MKILALVIIVVVGLLLGYWVGKNNA